MNFTFESLEGAKNALNNINDFLLRIEKAKIVKKKNTKLYLGIKKARDLFEKRMDDDLDTVNALKVIFELIYLINKNYDKIDKDSLKEAKKLFLDFNSIFDILERKEIKKDDEKLIKEREEARKKKDFKRADEIREELKKRNIIIEDTPNGPIWKRT